MTRTMKLVPALILAILACSAASASAATDAWQVRSIVTPAHLSAAGGNGELVEIVTNLGDAPLSFGAADPVRIETALPAGVTAKAISVNSEAMFAFDHGESPGYSLVCERATLSCEASVGTLYPYESIEILIPFTLSPEAGAGLQARVSVSGGGVPPVAGEEAIPVWCRAFRTDPAEREWFARHAGRLAPVPVHHRVPARPGPGRGAAGDGQGACVQPAPGPRRQPHDDAAMPTRKVPRLQPSPRLSAGHGGRGDIGGAISIQPRSG
jgi:hypothetical protein